MLRYIRVIFLKLNFVLFLQVFLKVASTGSIEEEGEITIPDYNDNNNNGNDDDDYYNNYGDGDDDNKNDYDNDDDDDDDNDNDSK